MKKVLLIGLRKDMGKKIEELFKNRIQLKHLDSNTRYDNLNTSSNYDLIISVTKFANRSIHNKFKTHPGYVMVSGGYSSVVSSMGALV